MRATPDRDAGNGYRGESSRDELARTASAHDNRRRKRPANDDLADEIEDSDMPSPSKLLVSVCPII